MWTNFQGWSISGSYAECMSLHADQGGGLAKLAGVTRTYAHRKPRLGAAQSRTDLGMLVKTALETVPLPNLRSIYFCVQAMPLLHFLFLPSPPEAFFSWCSEDGNRFTALFQFSEEPPNAI